MVSVRPTLATRLGIAGLIILFGFVWSSVASFGRRLSTVLHKTGTVLGPADSDNTLEATAKIYRISNTNRHIGSLT